MKNYEPNLDQAKDVSPPKGKKPKLDSTNNINPPKTPKKSDKKSPETIGKTPNTKEIECKRCHKHFTNTYFMKHDEKNGKCRKYSPFITFTKDNFKCKFCPQMKGYSPKHSSSFSLIYKHLDSNHSDKLNQSTG